MSERAAEQCFEIRTPNRDFSGERSGLSFHRGFARTSDAAAANACAALGYEVRNMITGYTVAAGDGRLEKPDPKDAAVNPAAGAYLAGLPIPRMRQRRR